MCDGTETQPLDESTYVAPTGPTPQGVKDMVDATSYGPQAYSQAMRDNLGMDIQTGGKVPTSGMTQYMPAPADYGAAFVPDDPLEKILPMGVPEQAIGGTSGDATYPAGTTSLTGVQKGVQAMAESIPDGAALIPGSTFNWEGNTFDQYQLADGSVVNILSSGSSSAPASTTSASAAPVEDPNQTVFNYQGGHNAR